MLSWRYHVRSVLKITQRLLRLASQINTLAAVDSYLRPFSFQSCFTICLGRQHPERRWFRACGLSLQGHHTWSESSLNMLSTELSRRSRMVRSSYSTLLFKPADSVKGCPFPPFVLFSQRLLRDRHVEVVQHPLAGNSVFQCLRSRLPNDTCSSESASTCRYGRSPIISSF